MSEKDKFDYKSYWENNYQTGGTSGSGSYGVLAEFKASVINAYLEEKGITTVMEFGCGDGNQLSYMAYKEYLGLDIAKSAIDLCKAQYGADEHKSFLWYQPGYLMNKSFITAELVVCLDVLYHIVEDGDFIQTLDDIFSCAGTAVILYTKIAEADNDTNVVTIKDRDIFKYLEKYQEFKVKEIIPQKHPGISSADFIILERK